MCPTDISIFFRNIYQTPCSRAWFTITSVTCSLIQSFSHGSFSPNIFNTLSLPTIRARELKFRENVHPPPCVTCRMSCVACHESHVMCQMSHVMCQMSHVNIFHFFEGDKLVELVSGGSIINGAYPV